MPRRRKKENKRLRSLVFAEDPVENQKCAVTPVYCADNPVTVHCVSVSDDHNVTWVSPQFQGAQQYSCGKRHQARRRHQSGGISTRQLSMMNKEIALADSFRPTTGRKFPALKFVNCLTESSSSEISRLVRDRSLKSRKNVVDRGRGLGRSRAEIADGDCMPTEVNCALSDQFEEGNHILESSASFVDILEHEDSVCRENTNTAHHAESPSSMSTCCRRPKSRHSLHPNSQGKFSSLDEDSMRDHSAYEQTASVDPQLCFISLAGQDVEGHKKRENRKSYISGILLSPAESETCSALCEKEKFSVTTVHRRLNVFLCSPSDDSFSKTTNNFDGILFHAAYNQSLSNPASKKQKKRVVPSDKQNHAKISSGQNPTKTVTSPIRSRRSARLREKYQNALKYLRPSTPSHSDSEHSASVVYGHATILVTDTPESEYGLSVRGRQLMKHCG